jgi:hypothetical protein
MDTDPLTLTIIGGSLVVVGLACLVLADMAARRASDQIPDTEGGDDGS